MEGEGWEWVPGLPLVAVPPEGLLEVEAEVDGVGERAEREEGYEAPVAVQEGMVEQRANRTKRAQRA